jgi:hypothetical protein
MSEAEAENDIVAFQALKAHAEALEKRLHDAEIQSATRLRQAELKAEAMRLGIIDLDGLKLLDASVPIETEANVVIAKLRRDKPWLFAPAGSSSPASPPQPAAMKRKLATEMSIEEWRAARAELLRRR